MTDLGPSTPHIQPELIRVKTGDPIPRFEVRGRQGTLTYDPEHVSLSADGDLPHWAVASGYAVECDLALNDLPNGGSEDTLLDYMVAHYLRMTMPPILADHYEREAT